jgi:hypothetical protein
MPRRVARYGVGSDHAGGEDTDGDHGDAGLVSWGKYRVESGVVEQRVAVGQHDHVDEAFFDDLGEFIVVPCRVVWVSAR